MADPWEDWFQEVEEGLPPRPRGFVPRDTDSFSRFLKIQNGAKKTEAEKNEDKEYHEKFEELMRGK